MLLVSMPKSDDKKVLIGRNVTTLCDSFVFQSQQPLAQVDLIIFMECRPFCDIILHSTWSVESEKDLLTCLYRKCL